MLFGNSPRPYKCFFQTQSQITPPSAKKFKFLAPEKPEVQIEESKVEEILDDSEIEDVVDFSKFYNNENERLGPGVRHTWEERKCFAPGETITGKVSRLRFGILIIRRK